MKNVSKVVNLLNKPKIISEPLKFPLSQSDRQLIQNLKDSFRQSFVDFQVYSLGISAPQIGFNKRIFLMPKNFNFGTITNFRLLQKLVKDFHIFINPTILKASEKSRDQSEYCLSVDDNQYLVKRAEKVQVLYYLQDGTEKRQVLDELKSRIFQHQYDHLEGVLISDIGTVIAPEVAKKVGRDVRRGSRRKLENIL